MDSTEYIFDRPPFPVIKQLHQKLPSLAPLYTTFERNFNVVPVHSWSKTSWPLYPLTMVTLYVIFIFLGKHLMKDKQPFSDRNRKSLEYWNLFLSTFSFIGAFRTVPHLLHNLYTLPFEDNICLSINDSNWGQFSTGLWVQLFIFSKPLELFDTYFIVVRKRPLIFLHWYHHVTVLLFCWHSYAFESSTGLFFVAMNYSVHSIMYGYYYLAAARKRPKWFNPLYITIAQILQMVVGVFVCCSAIYFKTHSAECHIPMDNILSGAVMYGSYFVLFFLFAIEKYERRAKRLSSEASV